MIKFIVIFSLGILMIIPDAGASGKYEISKRDPKGSPVQKSCGGVCACSCQSPIEENHITLRAHITDEFIQHRNWMIDEFFVKHILPAMAMMTSQMQIIGMNHTFAIGGFFDAKHTLETQALMGQLMAEADKDYTPSKGICTIGTNVKSLASSMERGDIVKAALSDRVLKRQLRHNDVISGGDEDVDARSRLELFAKTHCNIHDNANGLKYLCKQSSGPKDRINKDVDFTRTIDSKLTVDIDMTMNGSGTSADAEDIFALNALLFSNDVFKAQPKLKLASNEGVPKNAAYFYADLRSIAAKRNVAQNSISSIVAERVSGDTEVAPTLRKIVNELGVPEEDMDFILGKNPSYFAQMEVLTKSIYQNPVFYTELYDKPANVLRKGTMISAVQLMQERDIYKSQLRNEAVLAVLLETMMHKEHQRVTSQLVTLTKSEIDE